MYYPDEIIEEVRERSDIVDVISNYIQLKRSGSGYKGLCPFHNEKSPSFSVNQRGQYYHCFGCQKGGNVFTFIQEYENFTFPEAVEFLAERAGIKLPEASYDAETKEKSGKRNRVLEINKEAAKYFYYQLRTKPGEIGMQYFKNRKLSDETMTKFGLGYALQYSDDLYKYLKGKGYDDDILRETGLFVYDERGGMRDKFINRVMFPIQDSQGKVIGFGGRVLGDAKPKYLNSPETIVFDKSRNLYGINVARTSRKDQIIMCEGYMDVIAMHQAGFTEAAASLGTAFTELQALLLKKYTKNILLAYDSDEAGVKAAIRNIEILRYAGLYGKVIDLRPYKDPDEFIKNLGVLEFQKRIDNAENSFLFEIRQLQNKYNVDDPTEKTLFYDDIAMHLCRFEDELERNNYLESVCRIYNIDNKAMQKKIIDIASKGIRVSSEVKSGKNIKKENENPLSKTERTLLSYIYEDVSIYYAIKKYITSEDFSDELYKKCADMIFKGIEANKLDPSYIISTFEDIESQSKAAAVFESKLEAIDTKDERNKAINDLVLAIKTEAFNRLSESMRNDVTKISEMVCAKKALETLKVTGIIL